MSRRARPRPSPPAPMTNRSYSDNFGQGGTAEVSGNDVGVGGESSTSNGGDGGSSRNNGSNCSNDDSSGGGGVAPNGNLLNFELTRNVNTEWLVPDGRHTGKLTPLLLAYVGCIAVGQFVALVLSPLPPALSWTATNVVHGLITMTYLHWIKGSPDFLEPGGEMNGMTLWEQLDAVSGRRASRSGGGNAAGSSTKGILACCWEGWGLTNQKLVLLVVPTVLCHAACHFADYDTRICLINVAVWSACIVAKMPFMHGVRLLGINRTAGIDDDRRGDYYTYGRGGRKRR